LCRSPDLPLAIRSHPRDLRLDGRQLCGVPQDARTAMALTYWMTSVWIAKVTSKGCAVTSIRQPKAFFALGRQRRPFFWRRTRGHLLARSGRGRLAG
jgi:hypothetical protein